MLYLKNKNETSLDNFKRFNANDWEDIKTRITYKLVSKNVFHSNSESNEIVYEDCMDLTKVYIVTEVSEDRKNIISYPLKKKDVENLNIKPKDVFLQVRENYNKDRKRRIRTLTEDILARETLYPIMKNLENAMLSGNHALIEDSTESNDNVLIITNKYNVFGASYMLDIHTLRDIYKRMNSNFYMLPLSVHEVMCISQKYITKDRDMYEAEDDLLDMLYNINSKNSNIENVLSYKIYEYIADDGEAIIPIKQNI